MSKHKDMNRISTKFLGQLDKFVIKYLEDFSEEFRAEFELVKKHRAIYYLSFKDLKNFNLIIDVDGRYYIGYDMDLGLRRYYKILINKIGNKIACILLENEQLDRKVIEKMVNADVSSMLKSMSESTNLLILKKTHDAWEYSINPEKKDLINEILANISKNQKLEVIKIFI